MNQYLRKVGVFKMAQIDVQDNEKEQLDNFNNLINYLYEKKRVWMAQIGELIETSDDEDIMSHKEDILVILDDLFLNYFSKVRMQFLTGNLPDNRNDLEREFAALFPSFENFFKAYVTLKNQILNPEKNNDV